MTSEKQLHFIFRIACAMCFIGHGAFGIVTKQIWCNYFAVFGIEQPLAYQLMPIVGITDIVMGIILIIYPLRAVAVWLIFWGLFTASLRPLSGEPFAEFLERAGNYGAPLVLLLLTGAPIIGKPFRKIEPAHALDESQWRMIMLSLQITGFLLLVGHGWLNLLEKPGLLRQYASIGFSDPVYIANMIGCCEIIAAIVLLIKPVRQVIFMLLIWKMLSELFYPAYGFFEWVERGGSYAVLLGLWLIIERRPHMVKINIFAFMRGTRRLKAEAAP